MKFIKDVHGSQEMAIPVYVGKTRIDVHTNIHEEEITDGISDEPQKQWVYDEVQYSYQEYIDLMTKKQNDLEDALCEIDKEV